MFERSEDLQVMADKLYAACDRLERGDTLGHDVIEKILRVRPHERHWDHCVKKVRRRLQEERGIATWSSHGVGYRFCTEDEQINEVPRRRQKRARRQARMGLASVEALPVEGLSDHQQRLRSVRIEQMRKTSRAIQAEMRAMDVLSAKPESSLRVRPQPVATA